jgi:quercetin dioxygenase-like cupin family protein
MQPKRIIVVLAVALAAALAGAAGGTPPTGFVANVIGRGTFPDEATFRAAHADMATGIRWYGRRWRPNDLRKFERTLLARDATDVVEWAKLHPGAATKLGILPLSAHPLKQIAVVRGTMQPGGSTGFHHHPVPEIAVVMSGELTIYRVGAGTCKVMYRVGAGQAGVVPANHVMFARNEGTVPVEQLTIFLGIPPGVPTSSDEPDPRTCHFARR